MWCVSPPIWHWNLNNVIRNKRQETDYIKISLLLRDTIVVTLIDGIPNVKGFPHLLIFSVYFFESTYCKNSLKHVSSCSVYWLSTTSLFFLYFICNLFMYRPTQVSCFVFCPQLATGFFISFLLPGTSASATKALTLLPTTLLSDNQNYTMTRCIK